MTVLTDCDDIQGRGLIERYVAGKLGDAETAELEAHYLTCARCQADVELAAAIRGAPVEPARRPRFLWSAVGVAAAAGLAALILVPRRPSAELARLGAVLEPPVYLGIAVRGAPARGDSLFEAAMATYAAKRYDSAATGLAATLAAGVDSAPAEFFLATSLLMQNRAEQAAAHFRRAIALGDTPYLPESHYYLAKALLRLGRVEEATAQLRLVGAASPDVRKHAAALADSVEGIAR